MNREVRCYNCGCLLDNSNQTKEHIPPKNLFAGYGDNYKINRIVVPACHNCNNTYSPLDEDFRNFIGTISNVKENDVISRKAAESMVANTKERNRIYVDSLNQVIGVKFDASQIEKYHIKNFKGLFYYQYGYSLPQDYKFYVSFDNDDHSDYTSTCLSYLKNNYRWNFSGHENIFKYILQPVRKILENPDKNDLQIKEDDNLFACIMIYNQSHCALVCAIRNNANVGM